MAKTSGISERIGSEMIKTDGKDAGQGMCGRFYIDDETAREIEKIVRIIDRQNAKTGEVHPSEPALVLLSLIHI